MQQGNNNCYRHPYNTISHICTLSESYLCKQCIEEEKVTNQQLVIMNKEQLLIKLENEINYWKQQSSLEAQLNQKNKNFRHFKRVINKLYEQIKNLNKSTMTKESYIINDFELNKMEQQLQKLKTGNISDVDFTYLIFSEDQDEIIIEQYSKLKENLKIIKQDIKYAKKTLEQILNHYNVYQEKQEIKEDIFYKNCKKMCDEGENNKYYHFIKDQVLRNSEDVEQNIKYQIGQYCDKYSCQQLEIEKKLKTMVISIYIACKEIKYDLEIDDLFVILSSKYDRGVATNIIEDILNYK